MRGHFQAEFISSFTSQDAEVTAASGCHQNCLEAMSCVKTIEVIFEESRCSKIYFCFVLSLHRLYFTIQHVTTAQIETVTKYLSLYDVDMIP